MLFDTSHQQHLNSAHLVMLVVTNDTPKLVLCPFDIIFVVS